MRNPLTSPRWGRSVAAAAVVALSMMPVTGASAEGQLPVDKTAWFWSSNSDVTTCVGAASVCGGGSATGGVFGNAGGVASPISPGHFGVAMKDGSSDMRAYLHFDLSSLPAGAEITSFVVTLDVSLPDADHSQEHAGFAQSGQGHAPATVNAGAANILACAAAEPFGDNMAGGGGGDPPYSTAVVSPADSADQMAHVNTTRNEPASDCAYNATGAPSKDGSQWTFNVTKIARAWASGAIFNEGISLLPQNTSITPTWTVEFHGPALTLTSRTGEVTFVKPTDAPNVQAETGSAAPPQDATSPPPPVAPVECCPGVYTPPAPEPPFIDNPIPQTEPVETAFPTPPTATVAVAFHGKVPPWVMALLPLLVLGLALVSTSLGTDPLTEAPAGAGGRIASILQARRFAAARISTAEAAKAEETTR